MGKNLKFHILKVLIVGILASALITAVVSLMVKDFVQRFKRVK